jgi:hypothetical protein
LEHGGQGDGFELRNDGLLKLQHYFSQAARSDARADVGSEDAFGQIHRPLEYLDQFREINFLRGAGQGETSPFALKRGKDPPGVQRLKNRPQERIRDL